MHKSYLTTAILRNFLLILSLGVSVAVSAAGDPVIFSDGLTKVSDTKIDGYSLSGCFVSSAAGNNHGLYQGTGSIKTLTTSTKCTITLPAANSIAEFKFWVKALDGSDSPVIKIRRQINGGAWEVVAELTETSKEYVERSIPLHIGIDNVKLQLYIEKSATQQGYYFDDFTLTGCTDCVYKDAGFATIFTRNMVLQRQADVNVWGTATEDMDLQLEIQNQKVTTKASNGKFRFTLAPLAVGGPFTLKLTWDGGEKILQDIYVGDVWLAGGQSNMDYAMRKVTHAQEEMAKANYPLIKYYRVPKDYYDGHNKTTGDWESCTPDKISEAFAVPYYFAREVFGELNIPIGIIQCGLGGTSAESWMSREALLSDERCRKELDSYDATIAAYKPGEYEELLALYNAGKLTTEPMGPRNFRRPAGMYYTMFGKVTPFTVKGFLFYQGETNAKRGYDYRTLFPMLIDLWRKEMNQGDLPFLFVQLPKFKSSIDWADIRESQQLVADRIPNTGMAVAFDQGDANNIHPTQKDTVGMRLGRLALHQVYKKETPYRGPRFTSMDIRTGQAILHFDTAPNTLHAKGFGGALKGFTLCGDDQVFIKADARIEGNTVIVSHPKILNPVAVRYGWFSSGDMNLFSNDDFPAPPFRTDRFRLPTEGAGAGDAGSEEARLSAITIDGKPLDGFSPDTKRYTVDLSSSTTAIPVVDAVAVNANATVGIDQASSLTGAETARTATITVTAEDLLATEEYTILFTLNGSVGISTPEEQHSIWVSGPSLWASGTGKATLYSLSGVKLLAKDINGKQELGSLVSGTYIVTLDTGSDTITRKILIP